MGEAYRRAAVALTLLAAAPASAQELSLADATAMLDAESPDEVRMGIEALGLDGSARAVEPLAERIRRGLPAELLDVAIETLGVLGRREAGPVLFALMNHRRDTTRLAAVNAVVQCQPRGAAAALQSALSDADPRVRAAAALGLGQLDARDALDSLFLAFDRGVIEASGAIGQLARPDDVGRFLTYLGRLPLDALTPGINELVARRDIPNGTKIEIIGRLEELATPEVATYLGELADALPAGPVKQAAEAATQRIAG